MVGGYCEADFPFYYANKEIVTILGYENMEEFVQSIEGKVINTIHPNDRDIAPEYVNRILNDILESPYQDIIYRLQCKDGYHWFSDTMMKVTVDNQTYLPSRFNCKNLYSSPIIAMTANAFKEDEEKCLEAGMNAHLAKPLDVTMVKKTICEQIRRK